jgi:hypothetical protein
MDDLRSLDIQASGAEAVLLQKRCRRQKLSEERQEGNRILSGDRILLDTFFRRWKNVHSKQLYLGFASVNIGEL